MEQDLIITDDYNPTLFVTGFIQSNLETVEQTWTKWYREKLGYIVTSSDVEGSFPDITRTFLNPLRRINDNKILLLPSADCQWVGAFTNRFPVMDYNAVRYVGAQIACPHLNAVDIPAPSGDYSIRIYESRQFIYHYYEQGTRKKRLIAASQQSERRWDFDNLGEPLPFEDTSLYQQRSIKKRFTSETLHGYMRALGIDMYAPGYFQNRGVLIEYSNPMV